MQSPFASCQPSTGDRQGSDELPIPAPPNPPNRGQSDSVGGLRILRFCAFSPGYEPPVSRHGAQRSFRPRRAPGTKRDTLWHVQILQQTAIGSGHGPCRSQASCASDRRLRQLSGHVWMSLTRSHKSHELPSALHSAVKTRSAGFVFWHRPSDGRPARREDSGR